MKTKARPSNLCKSFAANVRAARETRGLSQKQLGQLAGLHRTFVGAVERSERNISIYNIGRLADALGVEPMELFKLDRT
jgi:transcriptional regulator with XRE-family HTH domain